MSSIYNEKTAVTSIRPAQHPMGMCESMESLVCETCLFVNGDCAATDQRSVIQ